MIFQIWVSIHDRKVVPQTPHTQHSRVHVQAYQRSLTLGSLAVILLAQEETVSDGQECQIMALPWGPRDGKGSFLYSHHPPPNAGCLCSVLMVLGGFVFLQFSQAQLRKRLWRVHPHGQQHWSHCILHRAPTATSSWGPQMLQLSMEWTGPMLWHSGACIFHFWKHSYNKVNTAEVGTEQNQVQPHLPTLPSPIHWLAQVPRQGSGGGAKLSDNRSVKNI